jgi:transcriptional regulator with XRE-family HTH domain
MSRDVPQGGNVPAGESTPAAKSREEFAARLRQLRIQAGSPSFRHLAKITNYSSSTLAEATSGRRLPTEPVVKALVTACGEDPAPWLEELRAVTADEQSSRSGSGGDTVAAGADAALLPDSTARRSARRRLAFLGAGAGALVIFGAGLAIGGAMVSAGSVDQPASFTLAGVPAFSGSPAPAPTARVADGTDPGVGNCKADWRLVDRAPMMLDGVQIGALDLNYSPRCGAGWAEIFLYPGQPTMMGEATVRSADDRFSVMSDPLVRQIDVYTDVIVPGPGGCLGASGAVYEAGKPVVTASIPCEAPTG